MNVDTFMTIMSFGLACFMAGVAYGKDHGNKKKNRHGNGIWVLLFLE